MKTKDKAVDILAENETLRQQLAEAQETLRAIQHGEVDALVVSTPEGEQVYSITGAEKPYRVLIEEMKEGAVMLSENNIILYCNIGFAEIIKQPLDKIIGTNIQEIISPTHSSVFEELMRSGRKGEGSKVGEVSLQTADKATVPAYMSVNSFQKDDVKTTFLVFTDLTRHMQEDIKRYTKGLELEISKRERVEQALRQAEERFRIALKNAPVSVAAQDLEHKYIWAYNQKTSTPEEIIGKTDRDIFKPQEADHVDQIKERVIREGAEIREQMWLDRPSGKIYLGITWSPLRDSKGKIVGVTSATVDLTALKMAEEALKESEAKFKTLAENAPDAIMLFDPELRVLYLNPVDLAATGKTLDEFIGKTNEEMGMPTELCKLWNRMFERAKAEKQVQQAEFDFNTPIGIRSFNLRIVPEFAEDGSLKSYVGISHDITELKKAEKILKENEHLYRTVFDNSQDGFQLIELIYDKDGNPIDHKFLKVNHAYEVIIGVKADDILDKTARYISPNVEPHWLDVPDRVAKTGLSEHVELYNKDIGKWLDCFYFPYSKNVVGTLFRDITGRKELEKQLQDSERLAAIGATAGMVGHDIRNPLQAIIGDLYLAKEEISEIPNNEGKRAMHETLAEIEKNVDYINKIIADLQDFARAITPTAQVVDLEDLCEEVLFKNGVPENIKASCRIEPEAKILMSDLALLKRILINLTSNAVQAMPQGGELSIKAYKNAGDVVITVEDTGVGIAGEVKEKLFTPMFTTKAKGQGFGLAVVKRMTEALGGEVTFESEVGKGTKFIVRLPPPKEVNGKWTYK